jgi:hypothetical protein
MRALRTFADTIQVIGGRLCLFQHLFKTTEGVLCRVGGRLIKIDPVFLRVLTVVNLI